MMAAATPRRVPEGLHRRSGRWPSAPGRRIGAVVYFRGGIQGPDRRATGRSSIVHIGVLSNSADWSVDAAAQARTVEAAGLESLHFGEHSHIPASRETPYPGGDGKLPAGYERTLDLFVVLTQAALATTDLKIGTGICQI